VSNAQDELVEWHDEHVGDKSHVFRATERCAAGILQAMQHFDLQPNESPRDRHVPLSVHDNLAPKVDSVAVAHEVVEYLMLVEQWLRGDTDCSEEVFRRLKFSLVGLQSLEFLVLFGVVDGSICPSGIFTLLSSHYKLCIVFPFMCIVEIYGY
jgi:hypothetical protein